MTTTLVLGGARGGKSRYAESLLREHGPVDYLAPGSLPGLADPEWAARIEEHRRRRPATWRTLETGDLSTAILTAETPVLIDCLATWLARLVDDVDGWGDLDRASEHIAGQREQLLVAWQAAPVDVVAVTNEVGMGVVPSTESGRFFRDELGRLNSALSGVSDRVVLIVAGRVLDLSSAPVVDP